MERLRVVFMGTPDFAVPCLEALTKYHDVIAVFTQPDRPRGRGQKLAPSPVKAFSEKAHLSVYQPPKIKTDEAESLLERLQPDFIAVVAFGQILSKRILRAPRLGCINVHASLLPRYRGAAPLHWAILNGEKESGVTTMFMDEGLDTGDMILKRSVKITDDMNTGELHDILMKSGAELLLQTTELIANGKAPREKQDDAQASYAPLLKKNVEKIDWRQDAAQIHNKIRGLNPWPGAYCLFRGQNLKLWRSRVNALDNVSGDAGTVLEITPDGFTVAAGRGAVELFELQPAGKRRMTAKEYIRGHGLRAGDRLE